jgi:hypothetical protein
MMLCKCGCGPFTPTPKRRLFRTNECGARFFGSMPKSTRPGRRATKAERHPRAAMMWEMRAELDAEGGRGRCIYCVKHLPPHRVLQCGSEACEADYQHDYHLAEHAERMARKPPPEPRLCACGCGVTFTTSACVPGKRHATVEHWRKANRAKMNAARRVARSKRPSPRAP